MNDKIYITKYSKIRNYEVILNGEIIFSTDFDELLPDFLKNIYKTFEIKYPKFFKMDLLSKLAFLSVELLFKKNKFKEKYKSEEIAVLLFNSNSSLQTDSDYFRTIKDKDNYFPSPAVFVYTLPNIMIGEICIRHKITGENHCLVSEKFDGKLLAAIVHGLFEEKKCKACIAGWVDVDIDTKFYESFVFLLEKEDRINDDNFLNFDILYLDNLYENTEI